MVAFFAVLAAGFFAAAGFLAFGFFAAVFFGGITTDGGNKYNLLHNERNDQLLLRQQGGLWCINLDGYGIYRYNISGLYGLAVDQQGHVYMSGYHSNDIHRLSPDGTFRDIVLSKHDGVDKPGNP